MNNVTVNIIPYLSNDMDSIKDAIYGIKSSNVLITILVISNDDAGIIVNTLNHEGLLSFPRYYIGTNNWFTKETFIKYNIDHLLNGLIGTSIWMPNQMGSQFYEDNDNLKQIYSEAYSKNAEIQLYWETIYNQSSEYVYNMTINTGYASQGMDAISTIVNISNSISNITQYLNRSDPIEFTELLNSKIINEFNGYGITGYLEYNINGDRQYGLISFVNILNNDDFNYFGYAFNDPDNGNTLELIPDLVEFPESFVNPPNWTGDDRLVYSSFKSSLCHFNIMYTPAPMAYQICTWKTMNTTLIIIIYIACWFMIIYAIIVGLLTFYCGCCKKKAVLKAGSWKLNLISGIGYILAALGIVLYGVDEAYIYKYELLTPLQLNNICNSKLWVYSIGVTLGYMPMFMKTWRLNRIFLNVTFKKVVLPDSSLLWRIGIWLLIDIILLVTMDQLIVLERYPVPSTLKHDRKIIDALITQQQIYGECSYTSDSNRKVIKFAVIGFYKVIQLSFGLYNAWIVSKITMDNFRKFDETNTQILAIFFSITMILMSVSIYLFIDISSLNIHYINIAITAVLISTFSFSSNILPRLFSILFKNTLNNEKEEVKFAKQLTQTLKQRTSISQTPLFNPVDSGSRHQLINSKPKIQSQLKSDEVLLAQILD